MTTTNPLPTLPVSARSAVLSPSAAERTFRTRQFANCLAHVAMDHELASMERALAAFRAGVEAALS